VPSCVLAARVSYTGRFRIEGPENVNACMGAVKAILAGHGPTIHGEYARLVGTNAIFVDFQFCGTFLGTYVEFSAPFVADRARYSVVALYPRRVAKTTPSSPIHWSHKASCCTYASWGTSLAKWFGGCCALRGVLPGCRTSFNWGRSRGDLTAFPPLLGTGGRHTGP
jgi:hypothetical protein